MVPKNYGRVRTSIGGSLVGFFLLIDSLRKRAESQT